MAGLLTYSTPNAFPDLTPVAKVCLVAFTEFTAAWSVRDSHPVPFSSVLPEGNNGNHYGGKCRYFLYFCLPFNTIL